MPRLHLTPHTPSGSNVESRGRRHSCDNVSLSGLRPLFPLFSRAAMQLVLFTKVLVDVALIPLLTGDDLAAFQLYARANLAPEPSFVLR